MDTWQKIAAVKEFVTIHDGYPKARLTSQSSESSQLSALAFCGALSSLKAAVHLLVLPRRVRIAALEKLTHEHLPLLMCLSMKFQSSSLYESGN